MVASGPASGVSVARRAWIYVVLAAWLIGGVTLVTRANSQDLIGDVGFSAYHVPGYAGLAALAVYVVTAIGGAVRRRRPWRSAFEGGYEFVPLGLVLLLAYAVVDFVWRVWFGYRPGIEGNVAPSRLTLAVGIGLIAIGPARAVLAKVPGASTLAGTIAVGLTLTVATFPIGELHPLRGDFAERPVNATQDDSEIWTMAADGADQTRVLTAGGGVEVSLPAWSLDGTRIAYTRWVASDDGDTKADVWVARADGRDATQVTSGSGDEWIPAWSPDGTWIAYTADPEPATAAATRIPTADGPRPGEAPGVGSPRRAEAQIWVVHPDGSDRHQLTNVDGGANAAVWSPDGHHLVYDSDRTGDFEIYVSDADGSNERRLTDDPGDDWAPAWSSDGTRIVFTSTRTGDNEVWLVNLDGSGLTRLTDDPGDDEVPVWSPDGSRIAFVSTRSGDAEIWSMAPDGSGLTNLTRRPSADDGRWSVAWSPDGRSIAYASAGLGPATAQPIVLEDLALAGVLLLAVAYAICAVIAVSMGLRFGAVTIVITIDALVAASILDGWRFVPGFVVVGLVIDLILTRTPPSRRRGVAAILTPAGVVLAYGLTLLTLGTFAWSPTMLVGAALAAGLIGWVIGTLLPASDPG